MNGYKQNGKEIDLDQRAKVECASGCDPKDRRSSEPDKTATTTAYPGKKEKFFSTLDEPEDWVRGYD